MNYQKAEEKDLLIFPAIGAPQPRIGLSIWLMGGIGLLFCMVIFWFAKGNIERDREQLLVNLHDRADVLILALEGGVRFARGGQGQAVVSPALVQEIARQPDVSYLAVVDSNGLILAHNDLSKVGTFLYSPEQMSQLGESVTSSLRMTMLDGTSYIEVYRQFQPSQIQYHRRHGQKNILAEMNARDDRHMGQRGSRHSMQHGSRVRQMEAGPSPYYVFVGFDAVPLEEEASQTVRQNILMSVLVGTIALGLLAALFWAQHDKISRRLLRSTQMLASQIVRVLPVGLLAVNAEGEIVLCNAGAAALFKRNENDLLGKSLYQQPGMDWNALMVSLESGELLLDRSFDMWFPDGTIIPVSVTAANIIDANNKRAGSLFIVRNLQEIKRLEEQVRLNERLTALGNLAAGIAHEIRNPLSSIKGFAVYLKGKSADASATEAGELLVQEVERLDRVVTALLDFARPRPFVWKETDLGELLKHTVLLCSADAQTKGVELKIAQQGYLPMIPLDQELFTQAVLNLLLNAIQATDKGGEVRVEYVFTSDVDTPGGKAVIRINDTGSGMPRHVLENAFTPYFTTKPSGTGLGLALTHQIIERHGGTIRIQSQEGKGTHITIELPFHKENGDVR